jgi:1-deoxy-D-xylulose-5-phosphate reductoisomerase
MREIVILGSTGSIGVQALEIVEANPTLFRVVALTSTGKNPLTIIEQAKKYKVLVIGVTTNGDVIREALPNVSVIDGPEASVEIAAITCDVVLNAITGSIGLGPTLSALKAGNRVALANKESLVAGGELVMKLAKPYQLIPVDSEHSAIWQSMMAGKKEEVSRLVLTASGGPFRERADLSSVTIDDALAHPTWSMGPVVTINSATLLNKGLEIIEAHYLFNLPYSRIDAVIHPQSVIHSMVEYIDGSTIAQASPPNMKGPIAYAINWPQRVAKATAPIDWNTKHVWEFSPIDAARFPAISLARSCGDAGGLLPAIFNAANESFVAAFLGRKIAFTSIIEGVDKVLQKLAGNTQSIRDINDVSAIEQNARVIADSIIKEMVV